MKNNNKLKQLRLTTTEPRFMAGIFDLEPADNLITPNKIDKLINTKVKGRTAYIHGKAERLAGYDIPKFIDGDMGQLDLPIENQDILLLLKSGEYPCISKYREKNKSTWDNDCYYIILKTDKDEL